MQIKVSDLEHWLTTTQVARLLDLSQQRILQMAEAGDFGEIAYTAHGRLFDPAAVEAVRKEREV